MQFVKRFPIHLLPMMALLVVLPFPGTVSIRLLCLFGSLAISLVMCRGDFYRWNFWRALPQARFGVVLWIAVCCLSVLYSVDQAYSLKEIKNEVGYALVIFFTFFVVSQRPHHAVVLLRALATGVFLIGAIALYSWIKNNQSWVENGMQGGVGSFSTYLVTCVPALFWLSLETSSAGLRWGYRTLLLFALFLAAITLQRVVWPALGAEFLVAWFLLHSDGRIETRPRIFWSVVTTVLVACLVVFSFANKMRGVDGFTGLIPSPQAFNESIEEQSGSNGDPRFPFWPAVLKTVADHPFTGTGFGIGLMKKAHPELIPPNFTLLWHAHNTVLNYAVQMGIPGAAALLLMFFGFARQFSKFLRTNPAAAVAGIAGIMLLTGVLLRNQTNDFFRRDTALLFWALIGIFSGMALPRQREH